MTNPITPPPELVKELQDLGNLDAIKRAYQAGADMELGECKQFMHDQDWLAIGMSPILRMAELHNARRPKPLTLAEQATSKLDDAVMRGDCITTTDAMPLLRAVIKRLSELESLPSPPRPTHPRGQLMTSSARAQRLVDEFEIGATLDSGLGYSRSGFNIRHGIAAVLYELVGQVVPEERAPHSVDPPESANTIAIYAMHAERTRLRGELVEIMDALTAPTLVDRALAGDAAAAKQFLHEAGFTDQQGRWLPQFQPTNQEDYE